MDWLDLLADQGTLKSFLQNHSSKASILQCSDFFMVQLLTSEHGYWKNQGVDYADLCWQCLCFVIHCLGLSYLYFQGAGNSIALVFHQTATWISHRFTHVPSLSGPLLLATWRTWLNVLREDLKVRVILMIADLEQLSFFRQSSKRKLLWLQRQVNGIFNSWC